MNNQEWFHWAVSILRAEAWEGPEAQVAVRLLLDWATGTRHAHLLASNQPLEPETETRLSLALNKARHRRPIPYIVGTREFHGRTFQVDERALIPREETELLVETALSQLSGHSRPRIADLGTGTGCVAITLALELPHAQVFGTDVSPDALALASQNAARLNAAVSFRLGTASEWSAPLEDAAPFDAVISNPPYIAIAEIPTLQPEIRDYEPHLALNGGPDGLDEYRLLATQIPTLLGPGAFIALELGAGQFAAVSEIFTRAAWNVAPPIHDLAAHPRVLLAHRT